MSTITIAAARYRAAAEMLTAYAAGEFQRHTVEELWGLGFDCEAPTDAACAEDGSWIAAVNLDCNRIEFSLENDADAWSLDLSTGDLMRS